MDAVMVRGSEAQDFLRCRKRWEYRWVEGLRTKAPNEKLVFGTLLHKFIETLYGTGEMRTAIDAMLKLFNETETNQDDITINEIINLVNEVARNYHRTYAEIDKKYQTIATELTFRIRLSKEVYYTGTIDWVFLDEEGRLCFSDHKTTRQLDKYEKGMEMDRQISRYYWAMQQLCTGNGDVWHKKDEVWMPISDTAIWDDFKDKQPERFMYNVILRAVPKKPEILKNGTLSKNKAQKTTYALYRQKIEELRLNENDYDDILSVLMARGEEYFSRVWVTRLQPEVNAAIEEFHVVALDSQNVRKAISGAMFSPTYRNINHDCSWDCEFRGLCIAEMDGSNAQLIRSMGFTKEDN
jgi:hypothetical protein